MINTGNWETLSQQNPFDGDSYTAYVIGSSSDSYYNTPIFSIVKTEKKKPEAYITYFPSPVCGKPILKIRIDRGEIYELGAIYTFNPSRYELEFKFNLSVEEFIDLLKKGKYLYIRVESECFKVDAEFSIEYADQTLFIIGV
jgi:hypothetical protein